jgi:bifunctional non-homologous end joining protein LigD
VPPSSRLPAHIAPMLATLAKELPADSSAWTYELKWDGIRAVSFWDGTALRLETRNLRDVTVSWPELHALGPALGDRQLVLDGEIVAFDEAGRPSFQLLQERMHVTNPAVVARKANEVPASYLVFDVLWLDGNDVMPLPWAQRREVLDGLAIAGPSWATTPSFPGEGEELWSAARERGMEGIVAKRIDSTYVPGQRSKLWRKIKVIQSDEFVVGGWSPGEGRRANGIGSLLLGVPDGGGLRYAGNVGTGFTSAELARLEKRLAGSRRDTSPFTTGLPTKKGSVFVEPELVVEVAYAERTKDGILRHPSYKGVRIDKTADDVNTGGNDG